MLQFSLSLLALATLLPSTIMAQVVRAPTYVGCFDGSQAGSVYGTAVSAASAASCPAACTSSNSAYTYAYYQSTNGCYCSQVDPNVALIETSADASGTCVSTDYTGYRISSTFVFQNQCGGSGATGSPGGSSVTSPSQGSFTADYTSCFQYCASYPVVYLQPYDGFGNGNKVYCACGQANGPTTYVNCGPDQYLIYHHNQDATVSSLSRRKLKERLERNQFGMQAICPGGMQACSVSGDRSSFECLDTKYELESCGGCTYGEFGVQGNSTGIDCETIPGVPMGRMSCTKGLCVASACKKGWKLKGSVCSKTK